MKKIRPFFYILVLMLLVNLSSFAQNVRHLKLQNIADFSISKTNACIYDTVTYTYTGTAPASAIFCWNINGVHKTGPGPFSEPAHTTGTQTISLKVEYNNSVDSMIRSIQVHEIPAVSFIPDPYNTSTGDTIRFINQSSPSNADFVWDFGNGTGSTDFSPDYAYASPGTFEVSLTATSLYGCTNSLLNVPVTISSVMEVPVAEMPLDCNVYPNPSTGQFIITLPKTSGDKLDIKVLNIYGQIVHQSSEKYASEIKLNLQGSNTGTYLLMIRDHERIAYKKIQVK